MRKVLALAAVALVAAAALWLWPRAPPSEASSDGSEHPAAPAVNPRLAQALKLFAPPPSPEGSLSGKVVGPGAADATVALEGPGARRTTRVGAEGAFRFEHLAPGEYRLDASSDGMAADPLGPVPLGAGEQLSDLVLQLVDAGSLSGVVLDARTRAPVPGAQLSAGGAAAVSDDAGRFELRGLATDATLTLAHAGYVTRTAKLSVARGKHETGATLLLVPAAHVSGKVVQADGAAAAGALVFAETYDFNPVADSQVIGTTGDDGHFEGDVQPGRVTLRASAHNGEAQSPELELAAGEARADLVLIVDVGGEVEGRVLDADGSPATDARVFAVEISSQRAAPAVAVGNDGHFHIGGLPVGVYSLVARSGARTAERAGLRVAAGDLVNAELRFGTETIEGRVLDASGRPLVGAQVTASSEGAAPVPGAGVESGSEGAFKLAGLAGAHFTLRATHPSGTAERHGVAAGATGVELRVAAQSAIEGSVFDDSGQPVSEFLVVADPVAPGLQGGARTSGRFATGSGAFHLECAPGRYRLRVAATGYSSVDAGEVDAPANGTSAQVRVVVHGTRTITGRVIDANTHQAISGARVATRGDLLWAFARASPGHLGAVTTTDASGAFSLSGAERNTLLLFAAADGYGWTNPTQAVANNDGPYTIALAPGGGDGPESFAGVGMQIGPNLTVANVFEGGPADLAGLRAGDKLVSVDGAPVAGRNLNDVIGLIRGEVGTPVAIEIARGGQPLTLVPTRAEIKF